MQRILTLQKMKGATIKYFRTDFSGGKWCADAGSNFHPYCFIGTQDEYDQVTAYYYRGDQNGKIIGIHSFDTMQEFNSRFGIKEVKIHSAVTNLQTEEKLTRKNTSRRYWKYL